MAWIILPKSGGADKLNSRYVTGIYVTDSSVVEHLRRVMRRARENPAFKEAWRSYGEFIERFREA